MVEEKGPMLLFAALPPFLPELHAFLPIIIIFSYEPAFHLLQLGSIIAAKKHLFTGIHDSEHLMKRTMCGGHFVPDIAIDYPIALQQVNLRMLA